MWLHNFRVDNKKALSPVELLVLTSVDSKKPENATELISRLNEELPAYTAERGTIYPILKRLENLNLLKRGNGKKMDFLRTPRGNVFLSSISNDIIEQIDISNAYFQLLANNLIEVDPNMALEVLHKFKNDLGKQTSQIDQTIHIAEKRIKEENWVDIPLE